MNKVLLEFNHSYHQEAAKLTTIGNGSNKQIGHAHVLTEINNLPSTLILQLFKKMIK